MVDRITPKLTFVLAEPNRKAFDAAMGAVPSGTSATLLSENKACDFTLKAVETAGDMQNIRMQFQDTLNRLNIKADICVQDANTARKSLLICDMDSTLIGQECIDELADFAGVKDRVSAITERAMRGEIGFDGALEERVGLLEGLSLDVLQRCFDERIQLNAGAKTLCQTMKASGAKAPLNAIAIGDGANDLAMIEASGLGIAYYAKPAVAAAAHCAINHTDLTSALYFQGYKDEEFKTG